MKQCFKILTSKIWLCFILSLPTLNAGQSLEENCPPSTLEIFKLPEEEQFKKLYLKEKITWEDFIFEYYYPDPTVNRQIGEWTKYIRPLIIPEPLFQHNNTYVYSRHPEDLKELWKECNRRGLLSHFFLSMVNEPQKFCTREKAHLNRTTFPPLGLKECACSEGCDRLSKDRRLKFETALIESLEENVPQKNQPIRLLSIGCGKLLQETILIGKLIQKGFLNIEMTLVDFIIEEPKLYALRRFFKRTFPEVKISLATAHTVLDIQAEAQFDLIYTIDFGDLLRAYDISNDYGSFLYFQIYDLHNPEHNRQQLEKLDTIRTGLEDLIFAKNFLTPKGTLLIGSYGQDMVINSNNLRLLHQNDCFVNEIALNTAPLDSVHIVTNLTTEKVVFGIITTLLDRNCQLVYLTLENKPEKTTSSILMKRAFEKFSDKVKIQLVDDIRPFISNAHATFLDRRFIEDPSHYKGAKYTVNLFEEEN